EMMFVDAYFYIISVRMGKRLEVKREIDDSLLDCDVPILILQPIIENAVEHGIGNKQKGIITMRVYKKDEALILEVENNGALSEEDKATIEQLLKWAGESESEKTKSGQLGMRNVNHRIKIMYGENYGLTVESCGKRDELTVARLTLPIKKTNKRLS
ncbi:MAG: GHKL domain-containing protein, partial [Ruminococcaceae bacterium]|nr:GHKL domain-containing protein [Oscillospiraceae bacterium]